MLLEVLLTDDAARDLSDIYEYVSQRHSQEKAQYVLEQIEKQLACIEMPERGVYPRELHDLGNCDYREVFFKPYRIVYRIAGSLVYIMLIVDGRRDLQMLLQRRLLAV
jgi:toxin ParE1/3/4